MSKKPYLQDRKGQLYKRFTSIYTLLTMAAVYANKNKGKTTVVTDEDKIDPGSLEARLSEENVPESVRKEAVYGAKSINYLSDIVSRLNEKGELRRLNKYLISKGYKPKGYVKYKAASNEIKNAAAFTDGKNLLGVNTRFKESVDRITKEAKVPTDIAEYLAIVHELTHMAQPEHVKSNPYLAESDAELKSTEYFNNLSETATNPKEAEDYMNAAKYALTRYTAIINQNPTLFKNIQNTYLNVSISYYFVAYLQTKIKNKSLLRIKKKFEL